MSADDQDSKHETASVSASKSSMSFHSQMTKSAKKPKLSRRKEALDDKALTLLSAKPPKGKEFAIDDLDLVKQEGLQYRDRIERQLGDLRRRIDKNKKILDETRKSMEQVTFTVERQRIEELKKMNFGDCLEHTNDDEEYEKMVKMLRSRIEEVHNNNHNNSPRYMSSDVKKFNNAVDTTLSKINGIMNFQSPKSSPRVSPPKK